MTVLPETVTVVPLAKTGRPFEAATSSPFWMPEAEVRITEVWVGGDGGGGGGLLLDEELAGGGGPAVLAGGGGGGR